MIDTSISTIALWEMFRELPDGGRLTLRDININLNLRGYEPFSRKAFYHKIAAINRLALEKGWKIITGHGRTSYYIKEVWRAGNG